MKKHLTATFAAALLTAATAFAQCPGSFTWTQSQPNQVTFTNTSTPQNPNWTYFTYDFGDNQTAYASTTVSHTYMVPGTYVACINVFDSLYQLQCTVCDTVTVTGTLICNVSVSSQSAAASCASCADGSATANVSGGTAPYTYTWSTGATTQTITNLMPGTYAVCVSDANGCTACDSVTVQWINSTSCGITFTPTIYPWGSVNFSATVTGVNSYYWVMWDFGDQSGTGFGSPVLHAYQQSGTYAVCATVWDTASQCTATWCDTVVVNVPPPALCDASFIVQIDSFNQNQAWIYNMSTGSPTMTYQWFWGDNTPADTGAYPAHVYQNTGSYNICLVVVDQANACTDTMCNLLWVARLSQQAASAPFYVNVVPPEVTGIAAPSADDSWTLYPNPANSLLTVSGTFTGRDQYIITDLTGRTVATGTLGFNTVDVNGFAAGTFVFTIVKENGQAQSKRFVRE